MSFHLGSHLREIREKLNLGVREVQEASARIARAENNYDFYVSAARLAQTENEDSMPSTFKLFSLCSIYGIGFSEVLRRLGLEPEHSWSHQSLARLDVTHPIPAEIYGKDSTVTLPVRLDPSFRWDTTQLVNRIVEIWGEVPVAFLTQFGLPRHMYGYVGLRDLTLYPLVRPGSLVMIDDRRRRVLGQGWSSEFDRPFIS